MKDTMPIVNHVDAPPHVRRKVYERQFAGKPEWVRWPIPKKQKKKK